jgi:capsid protein
LLEDRSQYRSIQNYLIDNFHTRVFEAWLEMAVLSGNLNLPNYESDPDRYRRVRFVPRGWEWVDPQKEIAAAKEAVKAGFKTVSQIVLEQGGDYESLLPQRADEVEKAKQLNLVFDTDLSSGVTTSAKQTIIDENQNETNGKET